MPRSIYSGKVPVANPKGLGEMHGHRNNSVPFGNFDAIISNPLRNSQPLCGKNFRVSSHGSSVSRIMRQYCGYKPAHASPISVLVISEAPIGYQGAWSSLVSLVR